MRVKVFVCPKCGSGVYARTTGDFKTCSCYALGVSGTPATPNLSVGSALAPKVKAIEIEVKGSAGKLEEDWQTMTDDFGFLPKEDGRLKNAKPLKQNELALFTQPKQPTSPEGGTEEDGEDSEERDDSSDSGEARAEEL